ncbi:MAG: imidazolonepropionase [Solirubrobacteraceae bacterium]|nr:imidazolonepropionase [Solirubrobacteraceae bacterium]
MTTVSIEGAAEVLRPPSPGLPYLRHDGAAGMTLEPGSLTLHGGRIASLDADSGAELRVDASGCAVLPGFVDCHTHVPFAGWRAEEYELKVTGVPYEEIARRGGGIASSARAFAQSSDEAVLAQARGLAREMLQAGTTTFECKTGYGLSREAEARAARLARTLDVTQETTLTGLFAHAVPQGFTADAWMDEVEALADELAVDALDIYVESVAFGNEHLERLGAIAQARGLPLRAHVEQFATNRSVPVALTAGARSVDHLACMHPDDVEPLASSECAAVLLPGAEFLGAERVAPARDLADAGAICVLGTDLNPGTSPIASMPAIVGLAVRRYGWSVREALLACTLNAAFVLGLSGEVGTLEPGRRADVILLDTPAAHLPYRFARNPVCAVLAGGQAVWVRPDSAWRLRGEGRP